MVCIDYSFWLYLIIDRFFTLAHEIAHNLVEPHNAEHAFWANRICEQFMPELMQLLYSCIDRERTRGSKFQTQTSYAHDWVREYILDRVPWGMADEHLHALCTFLL